MNTGLEPYMVNYLLTFIYKYAAVVGDVWWWRAAMIG